MAETAALANPISVVAAAPAAPVVAAPPPATAVIIFGVPSVLNSILNPVFLEAVPVSATDAKTAEGIF